MQKAQVMHKPLMITFTGLDEHADLKEVEVLSSQYPIEWGVLFSPNRSGKKDRYPNVGWTKNLFGLEASFAAHLCGGYAFSLYRGIIPDILGIPWRLFSRVQVNASGVKPAPMTANYLEVVAEFAHKTLIWQWRESEFPETTHPRQKVLFDQSGGRGEKPKVWPKHPGYMVGYAGGITPDNVIDVLSEIDSSSGLFWIDMESGVRTDDRLDLAKCRAVCEAVYGK